MHLEVELNNKKLAEVFEAYRPQMVKIATDMIGEDDAEDVVQEACAEVLTLPESAANPEGLLFQYLRWRCTDILRARSGVDVIVLEADLGDVDDDGETRPATLSDLEDLSAAQGGIPPWPTAIDPVTPEHTAMANEVRDIVRDIALSTVGERDYAIFLAVAEDDMPQWKVAKEFDIDQATVSRTVERVRSLMRNKLKEAGYDV